MRPALGREDFFVSGSNQTAVAALNDWSRWPLAKLILLGETGSGKTHLTHVWANETEARIVPANRLGDYDLTEVSQGAVAIEDLHLISPTDETLLFHLHNMLAQSGTPLLLTSALSPTEQKFTLPDLGSRMQGTSVVMLDAPDDALLGAVILKRFSDLQLNVAPNVVPYLLKNIERSFDAAHRIVDLLDRAALRENRAVTRSLAARILSENSID